MPLMEPTNMIKTNLPPISCSEPKAIRNVDDACSSLYRWYKPWRRGIDLVAAVLLLTVTMPLIALAALLVKLTSKGPFLYIQTRLGRYGKPFTIYKLRTMTHNCERFTGPCWAQVNDPRVTPVGRVLRALHIDELPQFWNVIRGDMALIGPRPERPEMVRNLEKLIPHYRQRLKLRPGITGLAQVLMPADRDIFNVQAKLPYDIHYVHRASPWLDGLILLATALYLVAAPVLLRRALLLLPDRAQLRTPFDRAVVRKGMEAVGLVPVAQG